MSKNHSPWAWVPTLYFAEGVPYVAVMTISVIIYKRLGLSNADRGFICLGLSNPYGARLLTCCAPSAGGFW